MPIVLARVDERLIHGQVAIAWGNELRPERYLVVDDELAASGWEQDLYRLGAGDADVTFAPAAEATELVRVLRDAPERSFVLTRDIATMRRLAEGGALQGVGVNLGGIHYEPGRQEVLTYLHLTDQDREDLRAIDAAGVEVAARDLPGGHRVGIEALLAP